MTTWSRPLLLGIDPEDDGAGLEPAGPASD